MLRLAAIVMVCVSLAGCAIHPLPEDVTKLSTDDIVRQIRCEAREALRKAVVAYLASFREQPELLRLADRYESQPEAINEFSPRVLAKPEFANIRGIVQLFWDTAIAYSYDFDISEDNNLSTELNLLKPFTDAKLTFGIKAGFDRKRANVRTFTVTDTFSYLLTKVPPLYCQGQLQGENYIYPIVGRIGLDRTIRDFINLTLFNGLSGTKDKPTGPPTMVDQLTFTTKLSGSLTPSIEFTPVGRVLQISSGNVSGFADRTDIHQVTVGLAIATGALVDLDPVRLGLFSPNRGALVVGRRVTGGGTISERLAVAAIDQFQSREVRILPAQ